MQAPACLQGRFNLLRSMGIIPSSRKRLHELGALHDQLPLHSGARNALRDWFVHVGLLLHDMMWLLDTIPPMHKSSYSFLLPKSRQSIAAVVCGPLTVWSSRSSSWKAGKRLSEAFGTSFLKSRHSWPSVLGGTSQATASTAYDQPGFTILRRRSCSSMGGRPQLSWLLG